MRTDIFNGSIVTGDGETILENASVVIKDCVIAELPSARYVPYNAYADKIINAKGGLIIPGVINIHAHGISFGPFLPYAWKGLSRERILANLDNHLLQGTTTILNNDGFALPCEVDAINKIHPVNVKTGTLHTPKSFRAAELVAGDGLEEWHKRFTAEEAVAAGAVALAEVGAPGTWHGTHEKGKKLGRVISANHALALNRAVLADDEAEVRKVLAEAGLEKVTIDEAKKLVQETSIMPVEACCDAIKEGVSYMKRLDLPILVHAEPATKEAIIQAAEEAGPRLIALHVNHGFGINESVALAKKLKSLGAHVDIITVDSFSARQLESSLEGTFALLREGLADVITTDFCGGYHDPILLVLQKAVEEGVLTLPRAIQLATSAPAKIVPLVAPNRGLIEPGRVADICVVDRDDISKVRYVIIAGSVVVEDGRILR